MKMNLRKSIGAYKVSLFFVITYWILDPILYWHFGNAYISQSPTENKWLVFWAGPFSFSENFGTNTTLARALVDSALSPNFWIPFLTILFAEWKIGDNFNVVGHKINMWKSYVIGVSASYLNSAVFWAFYELHTPSPGTSIIAFTSLLTYFVAYPVLALKINDIRKDYQDPRISNALISSFFGVILIFSWQFESIFGSQIWTFLIALLLPVAYFVAYHQLYFKIHEIGKISSDQTISKSLSLLILIAVLIIFWQFVAINPSSLLHTIGLVFFGGIYFGFYNETFKKYVFLEFRKR